MKPIKIADGIDWVGALDPQLRVFDIIMKAEHGTTYNSYLVRGNEKTALIDAVKENYTELFLDNVASLVDTNDLDYIVVNHTEPDHTGSLEKLLEVAPNAQVVISKTCGHFLSNILNRD
ncbi:MAG: MBL fold metallo-hydrolase, partial [Methanosarcinales archaeon]|nr:MBL fold metallo-hydrolase [Methanosarcinales archaeon]